VVNSPLVLVRGHTPQGSHTAAVECLPPWVTPAAGDGWHTLAGSRCFTLYLTAGSRWRSTLAPLHDVWRRAVRAQIASRTSGEGAAAAAASVDAVEQVAEEESALNTLTRIGIGGEGSGTPFHEHELALNLGFAGRKRWLVARPGTDLMLVAPHDLLHRVLPSQSFQTAWAEMKRRGDAWECTQQPGDMVVSATATVSTLNGQRPSAPSRHRIARGEPPPLAAACGRKQTVGYRNCGIRLSPLYVRGRSAGRRWGGGELMRGGGGGVHVGGAGALLACHAQPGGVRGGGGTVRERRPKDQAEHPECAGGSRVQRGAAKARAVWPGVAVAVGGARRRTGHRGVGRAAAEAAGGGTDLRAPAAQPTKTASTNRLVDTYSILS
jgi:hypothetical protein